MMECLSRIALIAAVCLPSISFQGQWWQTWSNYPNVPRISASQVKQIVLSGEKSLFIYCGYEVPEMICGSLYIPYSLVPPNADGSRVNLAAIPKESWIFCYCP